MSAKVVKNRFNSLLEMNLRFSGTGLIYIHRVSTSDVEIV